MDRLIRPGDYNDRQGTRREGASGRMPIRIVRRARRLRSATSGNVGRSLVRTAVYSSVMRGLTACRCTDSQVIDVDTNIYRGRTASGLRPGNNNELTKELTLIKKTINPIIRASRSVRLTNVARPTTSLNYRYFVITFL